MLHDWAALSSHLVPNAPRQLGGYTDATGLTPAWTVGSCPPFEVLDWLDDSGNKSQKLCSCCPPNYYDPAFGQGSGTQYVTVTGVVQGIKSSDGIDRNLNRGRTMWLPQLHCLNTLPLAARLACDRRRLLPL